MKFKITDVDGTAFEIEEKEQVTETPAVEEFKFKTNEEVKEEVTEQPKEEKVEEVKEEVTEEKEEDNPLEIEESLTQEEIKSLKELIIRMPELLAILDAAKEPEKAEEGVEKVELREEIDESKIPFTEETESLIDDSIDDNDLDDINLHDSKRSFGSVETISSTDDSLEVNDEISNAWKKRYSNGGK